MAGRCRKRRLDRQLCFGFLLGLGGTGIPADRRKQAVEGKDDVAECCEEGIAAADKQKDMLGANLRDIEQGIGIA